MSDNTFYVCKDCGRVLIHGQTLFCNAECEQRYKETMNKLGFTEELNHFATTPLNTRNRLIDGTQIVSDSRYPESQIRKSK